MPNRTNPIIEQEIARRYATGERTLVLARKFNCHATTIPLIARRNGVKIRASGGRKGDISPNRIEIKIEKEILEEYENGERSFILAQKFRISQSTVCKIIKRNGGRLRKSESLKKFNQKQSEEILKEYLDGKSTIKISKEKRCNSWVIWNILSKASIKRRTRTEYKKLSKKQEEEITQQYLAGLNAVKIADKFSITEPTVSAIVKRNNGKMRPRFISNRKLKESESKIIKEYASGKSEHFLANKYGVSKIPIHLILKHNGITIRPSSEYRKQIFENPEIRKKISEKLKNKWADNEFAKRMMLARKLHPNKPEKYLDCLLQKYFPNEYLFTGDGKQGSFFGKVPDFINCNGQKKIIELFGDYFHNPEYFPDKPNEEELKAHYAKFGQKTLVIWQRELKDEAKLLEKITNFHEYKGN